MRTTRRRSPPTRRRTPALEAAQRQLDVIDTQKQQTRGGAGAGRSPSATLRGSISATPNCAPRSTASSATAARASAPTPRSARSLSRSCRRTASGSTPISRKASSPRMRPGQPVAIEADVLPGERLPRPCRQPGAGHRRAVQRAAAGERYRQFHQDRAARARSASCSMATRRARQPAARPVGHRRVDERGPRPRGAP